MNQPRRSEGSHDPKGEPPNPFAYPRTSINQVPPGVPGPEQKRPFRYPSVPQRSALAREVRALLRD